MKKTIIETLCNRFFYVGNSMVYFSRYTFTFDFEEHIALYHSLRMKPVYLTKKVYENIKNAIESKKIEKLEDFDDFVKQEVNELYKYKILVDKEENDDKVLEFVKQRSPEPCISVCYFILSEQCNLACKYCFLGNNNKDKRIKFHKENMTKETAEKGIKFFLKQLESENFDENRTPNIIFYGGEPLLNFEILDFVVCKINELKKEHPILEKTEYSIVTNSLLLTKERLLRLQELNVSISISIDGCNSETNQMRVDTAGKVVFPKIIEKLELAKSLNVPVSLSITLTEESIKSKDEMLDLIKKYNIKGLGFNILMSDENTKLPESYNEAAAQFLIDMFVELRKLGIYEDRVMRKLKSFTDSQVYYSDCAATAGGQIVIASNGDVGICHGCLADRKYFETTIDDENFNPKENAIWKEWSHLSPLEKQECQNCEALGICGGGCPINAMNENKENTIHSLDTRFCSHAKKSLEFFISDLYRIISGKTEKCKRI